VASAQVASSPHNLAWAGGPLSVCQYCHAPHHVSTYAGAPLWNRTIDATGFTIYSTPGVPAVANLNAGSLTCLSCHDNRQNMGATIQGTQDLSIGDIATYAVGTTANLGVDLSNDHPVSILYPIGVTPGFVLDTAVALPLPEYSVGVKTVECSSCHDPHDITNAMFLRAAPDAICSECHTK